MPQSKFDALREHLLRAGIAPRHVRRYVGELNDHFDDLVHDVTARGALQSVAEIRARQRLGSDRDLAAVMLSNPSLRSLAASHPLAIFGFLPVAMVLAAFAAGLASEFGMFAAIEVLVPHPSGAQRELFVFAIAIWNVFTTLVAPLAIATALCVVGLRQRMPSPWIFVGIIFACFFGAFQEISFSDDGHHGVLTVGSGLIPPFPTKLVISGLYRTAITIALSSATYFIGVRRIGSCMPETDMAMVHAAE